MTPSQKKVELLAAKIRALWIAEHRDFEYRTSGNPTYTWGKKYINKWDGGYDANGNYNKSSWEAIANFCIENNLEPTRLIASLWYKVPIVQVPSSAHGEHALKCYKLYGEPNTRSEIKRRAINLFESQKSFAAAQLLRLKTYGNKSEKDALVETVLNNSNQLTKLFRYCVLTHEGVEYAENYAKAAIYEYARMPEIYDEVWKEWIPTQLRDALGVNNATG